VSDLMLYVPGMTCRHCVRAVTARLRDLDGVATVTADMTTSTVLLGGSVTAAAALTALADCGFPGTVLAGTGQPP
jgi:copper chaperone CopZ